MIDHLFVRINIIQLNELRSLHGCFQGLTLVAGGSSVGRLWAVTDVAVAFLHAPPSVVAEAAGSGAVAGTAGAHSRRHLGPLLQIEADTIGGQRPDAAQEASLLGRRSSWDTHLGCTGDVVV